jgi:hypothetical protein
MPSPLQLNKKLAKNTRGFYFGPNNTGPNFHDTLSGVDYELATKKIGDHNSILALTFHIQYYIRGLTDVLEGGPLAIRDKFSYDHPPIASEAEWQAMIAATWKEGEQYAKYIEQLTEEQVFGPFVEEKYGTYYDNLNGIIGHCYYHLGQIGILKKLLK